MHLVLYKLDSEGVFWDHMELEGIFRHINGLADRKPTIEEFNQLFEMTFGEAVNFLHRSR